MAEEEFFVKPKDKDKPVKIGPYNAVATWVSDPAVGDKQIRGHNLGKHVDPQVLLSTLEWRIRKLFDGIPETMKPVLRPLDNYYIIMGWASYEFVTQLEKVEDTLNNLNIDKVLREERPDAVNILMAGLMRAKFVYMPVGIGYGMGARAGDLVPKTVMVFILRDKFDNLILSCFNYEYYKETGSATQVCWKDSVPIPAWPKILVF